MWGVWNEHGPAAASGFERDAPADLVPGADVLVQCDTMARLARRDGKVEDGAIYEQHAGAWQEVAMHAHLRRAPADLEVMATELERSMRTPVLNTHDEVTCGVAAAAAVVIRLQLHGGDLYDASLDVRPPLPPRRG